VNLAVHLHRSRPPDVLDSSTPYYCLPAPPSLASVFGSFRKVQSSYLNRVWSSLVPRLTLGLGNTEVCLTKIRPFKKLAHACKYGLLKQALCLKSKPE